MHSASWIDLFRAGAFWIIRFAVRFRFVRVTQMAKGLVGLDAGWQSPTPSAFGCAPQGRI